LQHLDWINDTSIQPVVDRLITGPLIILLITLHEQVARRKYEVIKAKHKQRLLKIGTVRPPEVVRTEPLNSLYSHKWLLSLFSEALVDLKAQKGEAV